MKKIAVFLILSLTLSLLTGCGSKPSNTDLTAQAGTSSGISQGQDAGGKISVTPANASSSGSQTSDTSTGSVSVTPQATAETTSGVIRIIIPEGYTMAKICLLLSSKGVNTFEKLYSSATTGDFSQYSFLPPASSTPNRCYRLEGYLFPDTYDFFVNEKPESVWKKFLDNFAMRSAAFESAAAAKGMTLDDVITIASIIEKEASAAERANISAVIHNRLAKNMTLSMDSTYTYYEYVIKEYAPDPEQYYEYYYTYDFKGLPAGAVGNPGESAISAAINPSDISALYFFSDAGTFIYSDTLAEHESKAMAAGVMPSAATPAETAPAA